MKSKYAKYYYPGQSVTLFNYPENSICQGVLYLDSRELRSSHKTRAKLTKIVAVFLLFISLFFLTVISLPILDGLYSFIKPSNPQVAGTVKKDPNVYSESFILSDSSEYKNVEFKLVIPRINLESIVVPNVDSTNEGTYKEQLMIGVAHANGSYFPGQSGPIFLFAHSTDTILNIEQYNAKFFALKDLEIGDEILINYKGKLHKYLVSEKQVINPDQLDVIRNLNVSLILSTCFPPGTNWKRLIISAKEAVS